MKTCSRSTVSKVPNRSKVTGKHVRGQQADPKKKKKKDQQQITVVLQEGDRIIREENNSPGNIRKKNNTQRLCAVRHINVFYWSLSTFPLQDTCLLVLPSPNWLLTFSNINCVGALGDLTSRKRYVNCMLALQGRFVGAAVAAVAFILNLALYCVFLATGVNNDHLNFSHSST